MRNFLLLLVKQRKPSISIVYRASITITLVTICRELPELVLDKTPVTDLQQGVNSRVQINFSDVLAKRVRRTSPFSFEEICHVHHTEELGNFTNRFTNEN